MPGRNADDIYRRVEELLRIFDGFRQLWIIHRGSPVRLASALGLLGYVTYTVHCGASFSISYRSDRKGSSGPGDDYLSPLNWSLCIRPRIRTTHLGMTKVATRTPLTRMLWKPPAPTTSRNRALPTCAPSAAPTSCDKVGTQIIVELGCWVRLQPATGSELRRRGAPRCGGATL